jgi:hypothetical protein
MLELQVLNRILGPPRQCGRFDVPTRGAVRNFTPEPNTEATLCIKDNTSCFVASALPDAVGPLPSVLIAASMLALLLLRNVEEGGGGGADITV